MDTFTNPLGCAKRPANQSRVSVRILGGFSFGDALFRRVGYTSVFSPSLFATAEPAQTISDPPDKHPKAAKHSFSY